MAISNINCCLTLDYRSDYSLSSSDKSASDPQAMISQLSPGDAQSVASGALSSLPQLAQGWQSMAG